MVSLVAQPEIPLAIFFHCQASKFVSSCQALFRALSRSASSVGWSSLEDDLLESLGGMFSLGLGWCCFHQPDWIFSPGSDSESESSCILKTWLIGGHPCPSSLSDATWPLLRISTSPLPASASSSSQWASSSSSEGSDLLLVSWPSSVTWDWAEPDHQLWHEVILQAQLQDQSPEPRGPPDPAELSETTGDGGWSSPSPCQWVTPPNTLVRVQDALSSLQSRETPPCLGCHLL